MTQETLKQANKLNADINILKKKKETLEPIPSNDLYYGSKVNGFYTPLPREICYKIKQLILENLQEQINRRTKQLEEL